MEKRKEDRRKSSTDFKRRKLDRREKNFYYDRQAYLTDTNFFQNVYFAQYFDFIGEAREDMFRHVIGEEFNSFMQSGISISTVETSIKYLKEIFLFDRFRIYVKIEKVQSYKLHMSFKFVKDETREKCAEANMVVCFTMNGKPIEIPDLLREKMKKSNLA